MTTHFINKYIKSSSKIIDIGGGPGTYTIPYLKKGHNVTLVDLSPVLLQKAKAEIERQNLGNNLGGIYEKNATDLSGIESSSYDLTLCMGPMYHLLELEERQKTMKEAIRVTRPGGYLFTAIINWLCPFRDMMYSSPEILKDWLTNKNDDLKKLLATQKYIPNEITPKGFTNAYFAKVDEIPKIYSQNQVELIETFSCEGIASFLDEKTEILYSDPVTRKRFIDLIIKTSTESSILGAGEHTVFVGRKQN